MYNSASSGPLQTGLPSCTDTSSKHWVLSAMKACSCFTDPCSSSICRQQTTMNWKGACSSNTPGELLLRSFAFAVLSNWNAYARHLVCPFTSTLHSSPHCSTPEQTDLHNLNRTPDPLASGWAWPKGSQAGVSWISSGYFYLGLLLEGSSGGSSASQLKTIALSE